VHPVLGGESKNVSSSSASSTILATTLGYFTAKASEKAWIARVA